MKKRPAFTLFIFLCIVFVCNAYGQIPEGSIPAPTNIRSNDCPCILPDLRVVFRINAPEAAKVQVDLGKLYDMQKDKDGIWTVITDPQAPGFHYYPLVIDGFRFSDPASESFYGTGRMSGVVDIPEKGADIYTLKHVPHGDIRLNNYFSKMMQTWRSLNVSTPPGYDRVIRINSVL